MQDEFGEFIFENKYFGTFNRSQGKACFLGLALMTMS